MATDTLASPSTEPASVPVTSSRGRFVLFSVVVVVPFIFANILAFFVSRTTGFVERSDSFTIASIDYYFGLKNLNAGVVIFGDSTAHTGVIPSLIKERTGLTAVNLAQNAGRIHIDDTLALDRYLAFNARPKVIVLEMGAFNSDPEGQWLDIDFFEGVLILLRNRPDVATWLALAKHPSLSLRFAS